MSNFRTRRAITQYSPGTQYDKDGWEFVTYLSADDSSSRHEADEVPTGEFNRWNFQTYFQDVPEATEPPICCHSYHVEPDSAEFFVDNSGEKYGGQNSQIDFTGEYPEETDSAYDFSVTIGWGLGPISAGLSRSFLGEPITLDNPNHLYSHWEIDSNGWPVSQDESEGVWFNVNAGSAVDSHDIFFESKYNVTYMEIAYYDPTPVPIHSEAAGSDFTHTIDVVDV